MDKPKIKKGKNKGWRNLKPAKKGEIRNPKGSPKKGICIPDILRKIGNEKVITKQGEMTKLEAILEIVYVKARNGEAWAVHFIADRTEGKALERIETRAADAEFEIRGSNNKKNDE